MKWEMTGVMTSEAAVAVPEQRSARTVRPGMGGGRFRFTDDNPMGRGTYAESLFRKLPDHVAYVVTELYHMRPVEWDRLVEAGEVFEYVSAHEAYRVKAPEVFEVTDRDGRMTGSLTGQAAANEWLCA